MAVPNQAGLVRDPLFVAMTRPAMALGVPYAVLLANGIATVEIFLLSRNLLALGVAVPIHGLCKLACARDARFFELWAQWFLRWPVYRNACRQWGARTLDPLKEPKTPWIAP